MRGFEEFGVPEDLEAVDANGVPLEKLETIAFQKEGLPETIEQLKQTEGWRKADQARQMELLTAWQVERASRAASKLKDIEGSRSGSASPRVGMFTVKETAEEEPKIGEGRVWPKPNTPKWYELSLKDRALADAAWLESQKGSPQATGRVAPDRPDVSERGRQNNQEVTL